MTLRKQGGTYREIAEQLRQVPGISDRYNEAQAFRDVQAELTRLREQLREEAEAVREMELQRIDELTKVLWPWAMEGDGASIDRILKLQDQRARYIAGVYPAPASSSIAVTTTTRDGQPTGPPRITEVVVELRGVESPSRPASVPPQSAEQ